MTATEQTNKPKAEPGLLRRLMAIDWKTHRGWLIALLSLLSLILVAPVWTVRYPPLIDFPNHLASAFVLAHLKDPRFHFSQFYASNWSLTPYLTMDLILVGLVRVLPVMLAARVFLSFCLFVVPPAIWFFLRQANPGEDKLAFWSLLLCCNMYFFLYGFLNLQLGFALCFVVVGFWLRYQQSPRPRNWWLLSGLVTALYFTHIVGFGVAGIIITAYLFAGRRPFREILNSWALFFPGFALYAYWKTSDAGRWSLLFRTAAGKAESLLAVMLGYSAMLDFLTLVVLVICVFWACADNPELRWNRRWLFVLACLFLVFLVFPANYGPGNMVDRRLLPFIFVITLACAKIGRRGMYLVPMALLLFVLRTGNVEKNFLSMQPHFENLAQSFSVIPERARVLPFVLHRTDNPLPEDHFWAYGVINRAWFSPYLFHDKGVQPFRINLQTYTPGRDSGYLTLRGDPIDWSKIRVDYDYVWAYGAPEYSAQFSTMGTLVFSSDGLDVYQLINKLKSNHHKTQMVLNGVNKR